MGLKMGKISATSYIEFYSYWLSNYKMRNAKYVSDLETFLDATNIYADRVKDLQMAKNHIDMERMDKYLKEADKLIENTKNETSSAQQIHDIHVKIKKLQAGIRTRVNTFFSGITEDTIDNNIRIVSDFYSKHGRFMFVKQRNNSEDILKELETSGKISKYEFTKEIQKPKLESINYKPYEHEINIATSKNITNMTVTVDLGYDYNIISREMKIYYHQRMATIYFYRDIDNALKNKSITSPMEIIKDENQNLFSKEYHKHMSDEYEATIDLAKYKIEHNPRASFKIDDVPRAVGLWIWDCLNEKYGREAPPRGALTEAVKELKQRFNIKQYSQSRPEVIESKYRKTCECIEACEVLPF